MRGRLKTKANSLVLRTPGKDYPSNEALYFVVIERPRLAIYII